MSKVLGSDSDLYFYTDYRNSEILYTIDKVDQKRYVCQQQIAYKIAVRTIA